MIGIRIEAVDFKQSHCNGKGHSYSDLSISADMFVLYIHYYAVTRCNKRGNAQSLRKDKCLIQIGYARKLQYKIECTLKCYKRYQNRIDLIMLIILC